MTTLTPSDRVDEATGAAKYEGFWNGIYTLIPSIGAVVLATQHHATFRARTNMQSRTALAIMPAMFVSALTSELKLTDKMHEIAHETQHTHDTVRWADAQWRQHGRASSLSETEHLSALYRESIRNSGVQIVPRLQWYHRASNYTVDNPIKVLAGMSIPAVAYIFYGRSGQSHLQLQSKIMHTRVFGQFFTVASLLGVMAFQNLMLDYGRFISQDEADFRVAEMERVRREMTRREEADEVLNKELAKETKAKKRKVKADAQTS